MRRGEAMIVFKCFTHSLGDFIWQLIKRTERNIMIKGLNSEHLSISAIIIKIERWGRRAGWGYALFLNVHRGKRERNYKHKTYTKLGRGESIGMNLTKTVKKCLGYILPQKQKKNVQHDIIFMTVKHMNSQFSVVFSN